MAKDTGSIVSLEGCCTMSLALILTGLALAVTAPEMALLTVGEARTWHLDGMP